MLVTFFLVPKVAWCQKQSKVLHRMEGLRSPDYNFFLNGNVYRLKKDYTKEEQKGKQIYKAQPKATKDQRTQRKMDNLRRQTQNKATSIHFWHYDVNMQPPKP